jgi:hypothetical protein
MDVVSYQEIKDTSAHGQDLIWRQAGQKYDGISCNIERT